MIFTQWFKDKISHLKDTWDLIISISAIIVALTTSFDNIELRLATHITMVFFLGYILYRILFILIKKIKEKSSIYVPNNERNKNNLFHSLYSKTGYKHNINYRRMLWIYMIIITTVFIYGEKYFLSRLLFDGRAFLFGSCEFSGKSSSEVSIYFDKSLKKEFSETVYAIRSDGLNSKVKGCIMHLNTNPQQFLEKKPMVNIFIAKKEGKLYQYITKGWLVKTGYIKNVNEVNISIKMILSESFYRKAKEHKEPSIIKKYINKSQDTLDLISMDCQKKYNCNNESKVMVSQAYFLLAKLAYNRKLLNPKNRIIHNLDAAIATNPKNWKAYFEKAKIYFDTHNNKKVRRILTYIKENAPAREKTIAIILLAETYSCHQWKTIKRHIEEIEKYSPHLTQIQLSNNYIDAGHISLNCKKYRYAEHNFIKARYEDSNNFYSIHGIAKSQILQKKFQDAYSTYSEIKKEFPDDIEEALSELKFLNSEFSSNTRKDINRIIQLLTN